MVLLELLVGSLSQTEIHMKCVKINIINYYYYYYNKGMRSQTETNKQSGTGCLKAD